MGQWRHVIAYFTIRVALIQITATASLIQWPSILEVKEQKSVLLFLNLTQNQITTTYTSMMAHPPLPHKLELIQDWLALEWWLLPTLLELWLSSSPQIGQWIIPVGLQRFPVSILSSISLLCWAKAGIGGQRTLTLIWINSKMLLHLL